MNEIIVSVVIPVYNVENFIARTIESVQKQDFDGYEIILVDDGSKDKSGKICDQYAQNDKRIRAIHQANGGVMSARYAGIEAAKGNYIAFLDGDDRMPSTTISAFYKAITENDVDYVNGYYYNVDYDGNQIGPVYSTNFDGIIGDNTSYREFIAHYPRGMNLKLYRKDILLAEPRVIIDPRIKNNEDLIFNLFLSSKINRVMSIKDIVAHVVVRSGSASRQDYNPDYWLFILQWLDDNYKKYGVYKKDLVLFKLLLINGHFVRNKCRVDFSLPCFDNVREFGYASFLGFYNIALFVVKHPWNFLFPIMRMHPKYFMLRVLNMIKK